MKWRWTHFLPWDSNVAVVGLTLAILLVIGGCLRANEPPASTTKALTTSQSVKTSIAPPKAAVETTQELVSKAKITIQKYKLTSLSTECLLFDISSDPPKGWSVVEARELHSAQCGGDPSTAPRLFTLRFEAGGRSVWTDAKSLAGEFERLK